MKEIKRKLKRKIQLKSILFLSVLLVSPYTFPINPMGGKIKIIEINYENGETFVLKQKDSPELPEILNSQDNTDQYYLIRSGIKVAASTDLRGSLTFFGAIPEKDKTCSGENLYDTSFAVESNFSSTMEKKKFFTTCMKFKVEDSQKGKLEFDPIQENCVLEKIDDSTVLISAGDCFFKVIQGQQLTVGIHPETKCHDGSFLSQNKISPSEIQAEWFAYIYPDKTLGAFFRPKGVPLWDRTLFINLNPGEDLLKMVKKDIEEQVFYRPAVFVYPDFMLSNISIGNKTNSQGSFADLSFLISNYGGKNFCNSTICSNYGNFDLPFAPFLTLYEINPRNGRKYELKSFFMGDRLPGLWNGAFNQRLGFNGVLFEKGKKYAIELTFTDPTTSYRELKEAYKSKLGLGRTSLGGLGSGTTIGTFRTFGELPILNTIGTLNGLNNGNFFDGIIGINDGLIPRIIETFNDPTFPPEYSLVCNKDFTFCQGAGIKEHEKLSINFEVKGIGEDYKVDFGGSVEVQRFGKMLPEYKSILDLNKKPKLNCGGLF